MEVLDLRMKIARDMCALWIIHCKKIKSDDDYFFQGIQLLLTERYDINKLRENK